MKKLIWIIGGMSSGKSTIRRLLTKVLSNGEMKFLNKEGIEVSSFGNNLGIVGKVGKDHLYDGLDNSFGRLRKEGGLNSTFFSIKKHNITILEGSQTSFEWVKPLSEFCEKNNVEFYLILLEISLFENYKRLLKRIKDRGGDERDMTNKRLESVRAKNIQFERIFLKSLIFNNIIPLKFNTENKSEEEKVLEILKFVKII